MSGQQEKLARPALCVVIASVNGYGYIAEALRSLEKQTVRDRCEVIVVESSGDDTAPRIAAEFPWARILPVPAPLPIPQLRRLGLRQTCAEIVATAEDHCIFDADWFARILEAHRTHPQIAIGGVVENGSPRLIDCAAYICDYGRFMPPVASGRATDLPGPNVSYKRVRLEQACGDLLEVGAWESVLHTRLLTAGEELHLDASLVVYHAKRFGFWEFLTQRFYFGRAYAAARAETWPRSRRAFYLMTALLLPPLLLGRTAYVVLAKRRYRKQFLLTLPLQACFAVGWAVGEFFGYSLGDGGASLKVQ